MHSFEIKGSPESSEPVDYQKAGGILIPVLLAHVFEEMDVADLGGGGCAQAQKDHEHVEDDETLVHSDQENQNHKRQNTN